jgi:hypothetical protein
MFTISLSLVFPQASTLSAKLKRITFSKNHHVLLSSISGNGQSVIYILEEKNGDNTFKTVHVLQLDSGQDIELFSEVNPSVQKPYGQGKLLVGSKPPLLSGNGKTALFLLSLGEPENIPDHFLAMVDMADSKIEILSFPNEGLNGVDWQDLGFQNSGWERISGLAINEGGNRIALSVKGHLGPRRFGSCSGIILLDLKAGTRTAALAPEFGEETWKWSAFPRKPLLGGGWAFALSGDGEKLVFGAQSGEDKTDYDLYVMTWPGKKVTRITRFSDRWFSLADIDFTGDRVVFFYSGTKKQGIGTYEVMSDGSGLRKISSPSTPRIELYGFAQKSSLLFFKNVYRGMMLDLSSGREYVILDSGIPGYVHNVIPMDFSQAPAFWTPRGVSYNGSRVLVSGPPTGRQSAELFLLSMKPPNKK